MKILIEKINIMSAKKIPILASPNVLRLSRELEIDIKLVNPSSKSGRISIDDVKKYVNDLLTKKVSVASNIILKNLMKILQILTYIIRIISTS